MTANLVTHTFYMAFLPILFWCGLPYLGRMMTTLLAAGVFSSGFLKDLLCLPRPLSPPLTRISYSSSAALEYGFPSSHSTNAVSLAVMTILLLRSPESTVDPSVSVYLQAAACFYAFSIMLGRLYCGMHGFFDVVLGSFLGAALSFLHFYLAPTRDVWLLSGGISPWIVSTLLILLLVRIHPEPVDNCPCFDDTVAFVSVIIGIDLGQWHISGTQYADRTASVSYAVPYTYAKLGPFVTVSRIIVGVVLVFVWRAVMKPTLLKILPPIFRIIEQYGLDLPRRFFLSASSYQTVPRRVDDNDLIPSPGDIPQLLRRSRAVSVGPQSEADAYEAMAYRQKRRRDSITNSTGLTPALSPNRTGVDSKDYFDTSRSTASTRQRKRSSSIEELRSQMGMMSPEIPDSTFNNDMSKHRTNKSLNEEEEQDRTELFAHVQRSRVRYDVEVVTKLIVYTGIAWLAVEGAPILFYHIGLGLYD